MVVDVLLLSILNTILLQQPQSTQLQAIFLSQQIFILPLTSNPLLTEHLTVTTIFQWDV